MKRPPLRPTSLNSPEFLKFEIDIVDEGAQFIFDELVRNHHSELTMVFGDFMIRGTMAPSGDVNIKVARISHEGDCHVGPCLACGSVNHQDGECLGL
jgi:hypothetical protein